MVVAYVVMAYIGLSGLCSYGLYRSEWGPRALGHRSLLAYADTKDVHGRMLSIRHKGRYRPIPAIAAVEELPLLFEDAADLCSPFMSFAPRLRPHIAAELPAIAHVDLTSQVQVWHGPAATKGPVGFLGWAIMSTGTGIYLLARRRTASNDSVPTSLYPCRFVLSIIASAITLACAVALPPAAMSTCRRKFGWSTTL